MKLNHYVIGSISVTLGILFNSFLRMLTQPLSTTPFLPLGVNTIVYSNRKYNAELLYTNARDESWLVCVAGVYKAEIVNDEIKIVKKLKPRLQSECP